MKIALASVLVLLLVPSCKDNTGAGLVPPVDAAAATPTPSAAPANVDINQCAGCALVAQQTWSFQGIYRDDKCTDPLAQLTATACMPVPALGATSITYTDAVGGRKANESASATVAEQIGPEVPRFRKTATGCVRANEAATPITPLNCVGQRVCRDAAGALTCTNCRTLTGGCPNFEESRVYASISDPAINGNKPAVAPNGNIEKLKACCNALAAQAKQMGTSPEAGMIASYAAQCTALAAQAGPNGNAPELGPLRQFLHGKNIPAVCAGL